jgi:hypothetical protein
MVTTEETGTMTDRKELIKFDMAGTNPQHKSLPKRPGV